jgi:hypothetical protein
VLEFDEEAGRAIVARKVATRDPVDAVYGVLRGGTDEIIERLRGEPDPV